ncbi:MAG TPA: ABC transporter permease [Bacillota bacterium]|nr:ABC transporter permease [Bacillota bacterium]HOA15520.1 ABC transporter permease [Bacillota bacterium]HOG52453.1 ABC transporter permease [Bacillota bacterium]
MAPALCEEMRKAQIAIMLLLLAFSVFGFGYVEGLYLKFAPQRAKIVERTPFFVLALQHLAIALVPTALALAVALLTGCALHLAANDELKSLFISASSLGETFPSVAIIALSVPLLGYGNLPCMLALFIYALLPVLRNTITGLSQVQKGVTEAAKGMGMNDLQRLLKIELPLAAPIIAAGLKVALIINISAATLGASVGAGGLGVTIISGIRTYDTLLVIKGTLPVLLMALIADALLAPVSRKLD